MEFGMHLGTRGIASTPDGLCAIARHCEALGFEHLGLSDHIVIADSVDSWYPYREDGRWFAQDTGYCLDQLSVMSYTAAVTERIRLLTSVMVLPYREPILAAKMLATIDVLSHGRVTAGVGAGWMAEEMALLGSPPFAARGRVAHEYIDAFRALWSQPLPRYRGEHAAFEGLRFEPKPVQKPGIPIWVGGEATAALHRAAAQGDAWYPVGNNPRALLDTPALYRAAVDRLDALAEREERDPGAIDHALLALWYRMDPALDGPGRRCLTGSANAIVDDLARYREAGLRHLVIGFESNDRSEAMDRLSAFAAQVMAPLRADRTR